MASRVLAAMDLIAGAFLAWLEYAGLVPDWVLVSPARRAVQTWEQAGAALSSGVQPIGDARIGDNTVDALLAAIPETPEDVLSVAVVGHTPSIGELAGVLDDGRSVRRLSGPPSATPPRSSTAS